MTEHGKVREIETVQDYHKAISLAGDNLVVVDWFATWCGPCKGIAPLFVKLSQKYPEVVFLKADSDKLKMLSTTLMITALPTFHLIKQGSKVAELRGANVVKLEELIVAHKGAAELLEEKDDILKMPMGFNDLSPLVDKKQGQCLNQSSDHTWINTLTKDSSKYLESDCDEQLLLYIPFTQPVKLHSLNIVAPSDGRAPASIKLYINQPHLDFESTGDLEAAQSISLAAADISETNLVPLKFVKFQNVSSLSVFVESNQSGGDQETSVIEQFRLIGVPVGVADMAAFQRVSGEKGEVHG
eukprot:TRINITY_DN4164_c0_g1_i1.p1 TRINITY_DN4164_c0_g1~~TRINITY_DN4164_c0_g1_i1.p1  ORF type:complete len:299 (-),score=63.38 TRINITY_DN4164_c0_g1_i1:70-966(-)